ncbi:MAG: hypothetical protein JNL83_18095 [Myxococcales bacterium]|nr:hypothetical protein [Myxococcales bacterium]
MVRLTSLVLLATTACHITVRTEVTHPTDERSVLHPEGAIAHRPTLVLSETGALRFVEPLECPTERVVSSKTTYEIETRPNLATFVVGVIATAVGGVMIIGGVGAKDSAANPITYGGIGLVATGIPFAVGPWLGTSKHLEAGPVTPPQRAPGPSVPCGARALEATTATLTIRGVEVHGAVGPDGVFSISPYQLVDAYAPTTVTAWDIRAIVQARSGARTIETVIDGAALAARAKEFLAYADFNTTVKPLRLVPNIVPGTLRASLTSTSFGPAVRFVLPVKNDGPGEVWALRGQIASPTKAIDGRMIYIGHLAKGEASSRELLVPITLAAADALRATTLDISIELRDAHGTAPATPVRYRGDVLVDAPR